MWIFLCGCEKWDEDGNCGCQVSFFWVLNIEMTYGMKMAIVDVKYGMKMSIVPVKYGMKMESWIKFAVVSNMLDELSYIYTQNKPIT